MKYESYDEYINSPISESTINEIHDILDSKEKEIIKHYKHKLYKFITLCILSFFFAIMSKILFNNNVFTFIFGILFLFFQYKMWKYTIEDSEDEVNPIINEKCKIRIKNKDGVYIDFLSIIQDNTFSVKRTLLKTELNFKPKYNKQDFEKLQSNIGNRKICLFEYDILSKKLKENEI